VRVKFGFQLSVAAEARRSAWLLVVLVLALEEAFWEWIGRSVGLVDDILVRNGWGEDGIGLVKFGISVI